MAAAAYTSPVIPRRLGNRLIGISKSEQATPMVIHGGRPNDQILLLDGMRYQYALSAGGGIPAMQAAAIFSNSLAERP